MKKLVRTGLIIVIAIGTLILGELGIEISDLTVPVAKDESFSDDEFSTAEWILQNESVKYTGEPFVIINDNQPFFTEEDFQSESFESYSELDELGRCGAAFANISKELMPTKERGSIGQVKPTGWHTVKYPQVISDRYLYNRCHLIAFSLAGENANEKNLITGTRYMNVEGMLPFEIQVSDYVKETNNHVLYRVTPVFEGSNLVADGVMIEACSIEDRGVGVCFCVYVYNVQPGIEIDYETGESWLLEE